ncbi:unnamed protein product [Spirodela intermedia]|uniref:Transglycosylase SLT domain-containing protein n=1 Tax=Spirodela intermedia TaxID=51605 RepID=A0A7I8JCJ5_SPIIN|nr:unnamed protein product [Spirodela intermedia]CAA6667850.1 unnamed protein product [Spirodela intermedia]
MSVSFKYWEDCVDAEDMELLWMDPDVSKEWTDAGESRGKKVLLSRDPDGQPFLTQTEMRAVAGIIVRRHFPSQLEPEMICALADIESDRQPLALQHDKKTKETRLGIMEMGYQSYRIESNPELLYRPFINIYFGAAYIQWLSGYDGKKKNEEFIIRAYRGGTKKATHKSTLGILPEIPLCQTELALMERHFSEYLHICRNLTCDRWTYWDSRASPEDMEELWKNPDVLKEWTKSGERHGRVRFSHDAQKRPYLSRVEVKAVAEMIISRYFKAAGVRASALAALAEMCGMRFVNGVRARTGLMGIDYPTAVWLYNDVGCRAYKVNSVDDLYNPFASMYFGASYLAWLSVYEGRERTQQFVVEAYLGGPENVNLQETGPLWSKFLESLSNYEDIRKEPGGCTIL